MIRWPSNSTIQEPTNPLAPSMSKSLKIHLNLKTLRREDAFKRSIFNYSASIVELRRRQSSRSHFARRLKNHRHGRSRTQRSQWHSGFPISRCRYKKTCFLILLLFSLLYLSSCNSGWPEDLKKMPIFLKSSPRRHWAKKAKISSLKCNLKVQNIYIKPVLKP